MRKIVLAAAATMALAGMGHNLPPVQVSFSHTTQAPARVAVLPRRIVDENRRNQKLKQKLRRRKRRQQLLKYNRFTRKSMRYGTGYRAGKLFKGHRI